MSPLLATGLLRPTNEGKRQAIATCFSVKRIGLIDDADLSAFAERSAAELRASK